MDTMTFEIETGSSRRIMDLTGQVRDFCRGRGDGLVSVFLPHATAGLALIETGAGSDTDLLDAIDDVLPAERGRWHHEHGTPGHGRDHVLPAFISPSLIIPVVGGDLQIGTWQSVTVVDTNVDNHRRTVRLSFLAG